MPPAKRSPESRSAPKLGEYRALIGEWLVAPRKQRHTAKRIWRRLVEEHCVQVAETTVRDHIRKRRREVGLTGRTAEVDWGEAEVELAGARTRATVLHALVLLRGGVLDRLASRGPAGVPRGPCVGV